MNCNHTMMSPKIRHFLIENNRESVHVLLSIISRINIYKYLQSYFQYVKTFVPSGHIFILTLKLIFHWVTLFNEICAKTRKV